MRRSLALVAMLGAMGLACTDPEHPSDVDAPITQAAAVVARYQCNRCHDAPGRLEAASQEQHCVDCHRAILSGELDTNYEAQALAGWKSRIHSLIWAPSLTGLAERVERDWFVSYLLEPRDLRPELVATMPRLQLSRSEAELIADHFGLVDRDGDEAASLGRPERGRKLIRSKGCLACHAWGELRPPALSDLPMTRRTAPDLARVRGRMSASALLSWLDDPAALKPDALMPRPGLDESERRDIAAALLLTPPPEPRTVAAARLPLLERPVTWAEVQRVVFDKTCRHCHSDPAPMGGDGGPGNTGGFGYTGAGLDLSSREALLCGAPGRDPFRSGADGVPLLVAALLARHDELAGHPRAGVLGMPLGLPPVPLDDIRLVDSWVAQRHSR